MGDNMVPNERAFKALALALIFYLRLKRNLVDG